MDNPKMITISLRIGISIFYFAFLDDFTTGSSRYNVDSNFKNINSRQRNSFPEYSVQLLVFFNLILYFQFCLLALKFYQV